MEGGGTPYSSSMAPSGSYILIVVSQPVTDDHKKVILERLNKGLLSWDVEATGCDLIGLESVCSQIDEKHLNDNDVLIQHSTESLGVEVLVSPTVSTLKQCVKNLLSTSTGHKHLIHVGYAFAGSGSWILQNGTFSFDDFFEIFQQADVQSQKRCNVNIHCAEVGPWSSASFAEDTFAKVANVAFNPPEKASSVPGSEHLIKCLDKVLTSQALEEIMKASPLVGNIRFNRPTLYLFPAGQGDCALFGINGFNMLIDGGFNRKPCSWEFIRHLDRLDAVLVTRLCENNVCGMSTLMKRKSMNNTYPQIGYVFCNIAENNVALKSTDDLIISVVGEGHNFTQTLNELKLKPHQCWRDSSVEPFVLYHKVGHGTLEMHVLSPPKDSKEMKEFLSEWNSYKETFSRVNSSLKNKNLENTIPLSHSTSICAILVWRPADPKDTITRILFPGSAPQSKIFESLEKLKSLEVLKHPVVTKASLSVVAVTKSVSKIEKSVSKASIPNRKNTASPALSVSSVASRNGDIGGVKKEVRKTVTEVVKKEVKKPIKKESAVKEVKKTASIPKTDVAVKNEVSKEKKDNKDLKQVVKKESKDLKAVIDKKSELKSTTKKIESTSVNKTSDIKKTSTVRKTTSTTTATKKDINQTLAVKKTEARKSAPPKLSETKSAKDVSNKKTAETKAVPKTKPKSANTTPKAAPKTKPAEQAVKPGNKMTKAVAASSVVASAVAVTVAALELNEKNDKIVDAEPEVAEELKEAEIADKSQEINVSPLPPEAVSPTPSESISLTPSDTLSSAPLETVSPTPPLTNEPISMEEKEVNEIKEIEQDLIPYEIEATQEGAIENVEQQLEDLNNKADEMELTHVKLQENADAMSTSFIGAQDIDTPEIEEVVLKNEAAPEQFSAANILGTYSEKNVEEAKFETEDGNKEISKDGDDDIEKKEMNIDDQLAHISMEGSFCAGRSPFQQENRDLPEDSNVKISEGEQCISDFIEQDIHNESESKEFGYNEKVTDVNEPEMNENFVGEIQSKNELEIHDVVEEIEKEHEIEVQESFVEEKQEVEKLESFVEKKQEIETLENFVEEKQEIETLENFVEETQEVGMPESFVEERQEIEIPKSFVEEKQEGGMPVSFVEEKQEVEMQENFVEEKPEVEMQENFVEQKQEIEMPESFAEVKQEVEMPESFIGEKQEVEMQESFVVEKQEVEMQESFVEEKQKVEMHGSLVEDQQKTEDEEFEKQEIEMHESFANSEQINEHGVGTSHSIAEHQYEKEFAHEENSHVNLGLNMATTSNIEEIPDDKYMNEIQEKETVEKCLEEDRISSTDQSQHEDYIIEQEFGQHQEIPTSSIDRRIGDDYDIPQNIIDDAEMQESSVDEPEEIIRKESAVSITLNDNELGVNYDDDVRRKSCTESEDDVDIQNYMINDRKDSFDHDKLNVRHDSDSDNEDVVKSPTPHAFVDYEGQIDITQGSAVSKEEKVATHDDAYLTEKQDFDEKDRDSAEDQDDDDNGEMIRHPTPPEMKYSEDEMRDPIGQHYITAPGLKSQVPDITEQPLYEEPEEAGSERSISPVVEQPVFGSAIKADFPELVTVSGGTTPSEPQSPKTGFDSKKTVSESAVMDALSEHDCSESSTHSPLYQDGANVFELPVSEETFQKDETDYKLDASAQELVTKDLIVEEEPSILKDQVMSSTHEPSLDNATTDHTLDSAHGTDYDAPSDEESFSQNEKSETRSEKSEAGDDEKSDVHHDDKSDNQHDGKSDIMDDERKSDMHEDDRYDSNFDDRYDDYGDKEAGNYESHEDTRSHAYGAEQLNNEDNKHDIQYEKDEIQEVIQSKMGYNQKDSEMKFGISHIQDSSYGKITPEISEKFETDAHEMENISSAHSPVPGFNQDINIGSGIESEILDETHIPSADYKNIEKEDHVPDNFNIPSEFHEEQKSVVTDNYETNVTMDERYGTHSPNQIGLSSDKADLHHYGTSDFHSNEEINVKDIPEYPGSDYTQYESKDTEIMGHEEYHSVNKSSFSTETSHAESTFEVSNEKISSQLSNVQDDISPQFSENFSGLENKVLTEITEAKQYETLSKFEENVHTSNATYSESSLITNTVSDTIESQIPLSETSNFDNMNYNYISEETKHSTSEKNFEQTTTYAEEHITYGESTETSFSKVTSTLHAATTDEHDTALYGHQTDFNFSDGMHAFETSKFGDPNSGLVGDITQEENYDIKTSTTFETGTKTQEIESSDGVREMHTSSETTFGLTNGKDQGSWSHSEYSSQYVSETSPSIVESNTKYTTSSEQETEYIINSRFHSDSPEDNVMRSDSSPDVPPYPVNSDGHLDEKNSVLGSKSQSFIPDKDDYSNINLANVGGVPLSPNKTHNTNQDIPCGESSEDEDSSSVPGTVSHYAYTNKAYAKEEEDVDGNHIYMSSQYNQQELFMMEKSEILKEMEGQNQQTVTTHQMSYSQGFQESTGETNYDFHLEEWGKPMGLPTPPDSTKTAVKKADKSLTKTKTAGDTNGKAYSPSVASKLSSPMKKPKPKTTKESSSDPVYVDLAYVPHHGDPQYCDVEFFKKVRARYYVFSGINPSKEVLNALLEAKKSWKEDLEVTIIPTYETDTLGYWMAQNQDDLATYSIEVAPSASRCTVNLQDHETSCAAYRLEF